MTDGVIAVSIAVAFFALYVTGSVALCRKDVVAGFVWLSFGSMIWPIACILTISAVLDRGS